MVIVLISLATIGVTLLVSTHDVTKQTQSAEKTKHLDAALEAQEAVRSQRDLMDKILSASSVR